VKKRDADEQGEFAAIKRIRSLVRTEAQIRADALLNEILPDFVEERKLRLEAGQAPDPENFEQYVRERVTQLLTPVKAVEA
jgi:hypothetical protein